MDSHARSIAKAFTYRILGSISTGGLAYIFTGNAKSSAGLALADLVVKIGLYFVHERIWNYVPYGRPKAPEYEI